MGGPRCQCAVLSREWEKSCRSSRKQTSLQKESRSRNSSMAAQQRSCLVTRRWVILEKIACYSLTKYVTTAPPLWETITTSPLLLPAAYNAFTFAKHSTTDPTAAAAAEEYSLKWKRRKPNRWKIALQRLQDEWIVAKIGLHESCLKIKKLGFFTPTSNSIKAICHFQIHTLHFHRKRTRPTRKISLFSFLNPSLSY